MRLRFLLPLLLLVACVRPHAPALQAPLSNKVHMATGATQIETINTAIPSGQQSLPGHGREVGMAYGAIEGVDGTAANGVAASHFLEDGATVVGVQVNIKVPADTQYYQAWLEKADGRSHVSVGHLTNPFNDVRHSVRMVSDLNLKDYTILLITLQTDGEGTNPGPTVAKAILKPTKR